ncbi:GNAT family N-acetyltransferase [Henriciella sp.]|uniref:GNAT family N-acetyltransferase n=1 Tax=Henriciella sp. TaxID=1968823 RepID=UPI00260D965D|nr:N-acetyltransferase [Henriciella sp.]
MSKSAIRHARPEDMEAIATLNIAAFGGPDEAGIVRQLADDGKSLVSLVALEDEEIVGHIQFFPVLVDGRDIAAGLGPMSVAPDRQRKGIGRKLIIAGMPLMEREGRGLVFVLGHTDYYPYFGFSPQVAERYEAPWSGPAFMGIELRLDTPRTGKLTYPKAFTQTA